MFYVISENEACHYLVTYNSSMSKYNLSMTEDEINLEKFTIEDIIIPYDSLPRKRKLNKINIKFQIL